MFCHKCGTENDNDSQYCHVCGENISPGDAPLVPLREEPPVPVSAPREQHIPHIETPLTSAAPSREDARPMKFSTRVAYNILESDRKGIALFLLSLIVLASGIFAVTSCLGLVSSFASLSDAKNALPSGIQSEAIQAGIDGAWRSIWTNLAAIPVSILVFSLGVRLLVRIKRVADTLRIVRKKFD